MVGSYGNVIRDNVVYNRTNPAIFVYGTGSNTANVVEGNVVWNSAKGIYAVADAVIRNNIVFNSGTGLTLDASGQVPQMKNVTAVNNTLYDNQQGIYMRWPAGALNMALANNAVYSPGKVALNMAGSAGSFAANYIQGASDRALDGVAFVNGGSASNAFVNPANRNVWPRMILSPLVNRASGGYAPSDDFNHNSRMLPFDVGAYESNGMPGNPGWAITPGFKTNDGSSILELIPLLSTPRSRRRPGSIIQP
jgi:hypothetical protein